MTKKGWIPAFAGMTVKEFMSRSVRCTTLGRWEADKKIKLQNEK
jgi:hypothetical protein